MNRSSKIVVGLTAAAAVASAAAAGASPADQEVLGTIASSVSISTTPTASVDFGTFSVGPNATSGGTVGVTANEPYTLTVVGEKATMSEWDGAAYVSGGAVLTSPLTVTPTLTGGIGVPVPGIVGTVAVPIATSVGLTTDTYSLSLAQPVIVTDEPGDYRNNLTYTAAPTL